jgi:hypothetical protein
MECGTVSAAVCYSSYVLHQYIGSHILFSFGTIVVLFSAIGTLSQEHPIVSSRVTWIPRVVGQVSRTTEVYILIFIACSIAAFMELCLLAHRLGYHYGARFGSTFYWVVLPIFAIILVVMFWRCGAEICTFGRPKAVGATRFIRRHKKKSGVVLALAFVTIIFWTDVYFKGVGMALQDLGKTWSIIESGFFNYISIFTLCVLWIFTVVSSASFTYYLIPGNIATRYTCIPRAIQILLATFAVTHAFFWSKSNIGGILSNLWWRYSGNGRILNLTIAAILVTLVGINSLPVNAQGHRSSIYTVLVAIATVLVVFQYQFNLAGIFTELGIRSFIMAGRANLADLTSRAFSYGRWFISLALSIVWSIALFLFSWSFRAAIGRFLSLTYKQTFGLLFIIVLIVGIAYLTRNVPYLGFLWSCIRELAIIIAAIILATLIWLPMAVVRTLTFFSWIVNGLANYVVKFINIWIARGNDLRAIVGIGITLWLFGWLLPNKPQAEAFQFSAPIQESNMGYSFLPFTVVAGLCFIAWRRSTNSAPMSI